jgi:hypothetical protein
MTIDCSALVVAGTAIPLSHWLASLFLPSWLVQTPFIGLNLLQAAFTGFCPGAIVFRKL